jgi:hypothetical protein
MELLGLFTAAYEEHCAAHAAVVIPHLGVIPLPSVLVAAVIDFLTKTREEFAQAMIRTLTNGREWNMSYQSRNDGHSVIIINSYGWRNDRIPAKIKELDNLPALASRINGLGFPKQVVASILRDRLAARIEFFRKKLIVNV